MGEIEKIHQINPALNTINSTHRVTERAERHGSHKEEKRRQEEDRLELHEEEDEPKPPVPVRDQSEEGGLDIAI